ncbi:cupin domain-containing protein [Prosthecomicrobium hirschii]|uniref:cupin domain-containing protein n=1 Tax=Prosthecodimorpha hirschii TaxID=665126 RepID=UPI00221E37F4|nr:cupin domain-containing protein [Prosthecomicrobium hirschii]MCW1843824.1 cupin domain-containing protein [Prosthecomicrobium hirschii]
MTGIVRIDTSPLDRVADPIDPAKVLAGAPVTGTRPATEDDVRGFYTGVWESAPGKWAVDYAEDELCVILAGRLRLTSEAGHAEEFSAGQSFVIPRGFRGTWETGPQDLRDLDRVEPFQGIASRFGVPLSDEA